MGARQAAQLHRAPDCSGFLCRPNWIARTVDLIILGAVTGFVIGAGGTIALKLRLFFYSDTIKLPYALVSCDPLANAKTLDQPISSVGEAGWHPVQAILEHLIWRWPIGRHARDFRPWRRLPALQPSRICEVDRVVLYVSIEIEATSEPGAIFAYEPSRSRVVVSGAVVALRAKAQESWPRGHT